jgi:antitoxin ParD1/3/4
MRTTRQLSVTLPIEMAESVKAKVASGAYASESEVIREGLRALSEKDEAFDDWIRREVLPISDEMRRHPERLIPIDEAFKDLEQGYWAPRTNKSR